MADCHLVSYRNAGFNPAAIASRTPGPCPGGSRPHGIPKVYDTWQELLADESLEILDVALPAGSAAGDCPPGGECPNLKGILCQKPLEMSLERAREIARLGRRSGKANAVNSNMRCDQSMRR